MFTGINYFRDLALYYEKHECYPYDDEYREIYNELNPPNSKTKIPVPFDALPYYMQDFAKEQIARFVNGDSHGDTKLTGEHSFYLNVIQIDRTVVNSPGIHKNNPLHSRKVGRRVSAFPDFWDEDWRYFWACDIARFGLETGKELERYKELCKPCSLDLIETVDNLSGGLDIFWLKPRGVGAEQPHSEILISPNGEIKMGDVKVGTQLFDRYGNITNVTEVLPQGIKEIWKIKLLDGREVTCGKNHLWTVETRIRKGVPEYKTYTTKQLYDLGLTYGHKSGQKTYKYKVPELQPVKFPEKELSIPPYVLGALLGDGSMSTKNIKLASDDIEIVDKVITKLNEKWDNAYTYSKDLVNNNYTLILKEKYGYNNLDYKNAKFGCNPLKREIELLNLNVTSESKFIPDVYKYSSIKQRIELVRGLMDTDGSITKDGYCEFTQKNKRLIDDLAYVLRSLGIYCSIGYSERNGEKTIIDRSGRSSTFEASGYWRLYIATNKPIFSLKRKVNRINKTKQTKSSTAIIDIYPTGLYEEQSCIIVDNKEHLYLTRDFIVTHNSWKGGAKANYNQFLVPDSNTFIMAETEPYLIGDGIFDKFNKIRSFIQGKCWFLSKQFYKESLSEFEYSTGLKKNVGGGTITEGFSSTVSGLIIDAKPGKARGKRGDILFEESGSFPSMDDVWNVTEASVNEYGVIYGQRRAFGTGGDKGGNFEFMEKAMADPAAYRLIQCNNPYDEFEKPISFFTNCYTNITDKDENGNSLKDVAKQKFDKIEAELQKGEDITRLDKHKAEYPRKPSDAFRKITGSILPGALAANRLELLKKSNIDRKICSYGWLKQIGKDIQFFPDDVIPFEQYPIKNDGNSKKGCISIFQEPYRVRGIVPADLYTIHVDAYTQDEAESGSIGSVYVYEQPNRYTRYKGDICPAWYNARPEGFNGSDEFAKNVFLLAEFYNAQIALENDQVGELVSYAKKHTDSKGRKLTLYLADQFEIGFNEDIVTKAKMKRAFGMNMTEGRKKQGLKYFQEWLVTPRGQNEDGVTIYNIDLIYDRGLLEEIKKYEYGKNADRISSWLIGMYHIREIEYQESKRSKSQRNSLQDLQLF